MFTTSKFDFSLPPLQIILKRKSYSVYSKLHVIVGFYNLHPRIFTIVYEERIPAARPNLTLDLRIVVNRLPERP